MAFLNAWPCPCVCQWQSLVGLPKKKKKANIAKRFCYLTWVLPAIDEKSATVVSGRSTKSMEEKVVTYSLTFSLDPVSRSVWSHQAVSSSVLCVFSSAEQFLIRRDWRASLSLSVIRSNHILADWLPQLRRARRRQETTDRSCRRRRRCCDLKIN